MGISSINHSSKARPRAVLSRQEFVDLVWSMSLQAIAERFGVSRTAIAKLCSRQAIPVPKQGYWKVAACKRLDLKASVPRRPPGYATTIQVGKAPEHFNISQIEHDYTESLEDLKRRLKAEIADLPTKAGRLKNTPDTQRFLDADEVRIALHGIRNPYPEILGPFFTGTLARRKLAVLNWLQSYAPRFGSKVKVGGRKAERVVFIAGHIRIFLTFNDPAVPGWLVSVFGKNQEAKLQMTAAVQGTREQTAKIWKDTALAPLESRTQTILLDLLVMAEDALRAK